VRPCIVCGLLVAIVVCGPMFMFTLSGVIFGVGMTVGAMNFMSWLFPLRRGRSQTHRNSQEVSSLRRLLVMQRRLNPDIDKMKTKVLVATSANQLPFRNSVRIKSRKVVILHYHFRVEASTAR
jgi:hypothetical protein